MSYNYIHFFIFFIIAPITIIYTFLFFLLLHPYLASPLPPSSPAALALSHCAPHALWSYFRRILPYIFRTKGFEPAPCEMKLGSSTTEPKAAYIQYSPCNVLYIIMAGKANIVPPAPLRPLRCLPPLAATS